MRTRNIDPFIACALSHFCQLDPIQAFLVTDTEISLTKDVTILLCAGPLTRFY